MATPACVDQNDNALIIGASGGIGAAFASVAGAHYGHIHTLSRQHNGFDLADEASIRDAAESVKARGITLSLIFIATGVLDIIGNDGSTTGPEKSFRTLDGEIAARAMAVNAIGPALVYKYFSSLMVRKGPSRFVALSARVGSIGDNGLGGWMSYRASKAALNQFIRCAAIEETRRNPQSVVVALHPGTVPTRLTKMYARDRYTASPEDSAKQLMTVLRRLSPEDSGGFFAYDGSAVPW